MYFISGLARTLSTLVSTPKCAPPSLFEVRRIRIFHLFNNEAKAERLQPLQLEAAFADYGVSEV
jgi:hypothetical protein